MTRADASGDARARWLLPAEDDLIRAIGRAVYGFAQLERAVERARGALAGRFGQRFDQLPGDGADGPASEPAAAFLRIHRRCAALRSERDVLLRACADGTGGAARCGAGEARTWRTADIERMARAADAAAIEANHLFRQHA